jgi:hypothetical protein
MIAEFILAGMAAEGVGLVVYRAVTGRGPKALVANFLAGGALLLAWSASESGASQAVVFAALAAAGIGHVLDLAARWREPDSTATPQIGAGTIRLRAARRQAPVSPPSGR